MFYIYVLESLKNKTLYIGYTTDLAKRCKEHNQGLTISTKRYRPWKLIYTMKLILKRVMRYDERNILKPHKVVDY